MRGRQEVRSGSVAGIIDGSAAQLRHFVHLIILLAIHGGLHVVFVQVVCQLFLSSLLGFHGEIAAKVCVEHPQLLRQLELLTATLIAVGLLVE